MASRERDPSNIVRFWVFMRFPHLCWFTGGYHLLGVTRRVCSASDMYEVHMMQCNTMKPCIILCYVALCYVMCSGLRVTELLENEFDSNTVPSTWLFLLLLEIGTKDLNTRAITILTQLILSS